MKVFGLIYGNNTAVFSDERERAKAIKQLEENTKLKFPIEYDTFESDVYNTVEDFIYKTIKN